MYVTGRRDSNRGLTAGPPTYTRRPTSATPAASTHFADYLSRKRVETLMSNEDKKHRSHLPIATPGRTGFMDPAGAKAAL
jgi:hypothetical protein